MLTSSEESLPDISMQSSHVQPTTESASTPVTTKSVLVAAAIPHEPMTSTSGTPTVSKPEVLFSSYQLAGESYCDRATSIFHSIYYSVYPSAVGPGT